MHFDAGVQDPGRARELDAHELCDDAPAVDGDRAEMFRIEGTQNVFRKRLLTITLTEKIREPFLTLRRPGRQAWRPGLFYGAPRSHLQVITKRRKNYSP